MTDWQPIETAPTDGTPILVTGGYPDVASDYRIWSDDEDEYVSSFPSPVIVVWRQHEEWRYCSYDSGIYGEWHEPTHWQPLPEPPTE